MLELAKNFIFVIAVTAVPIVLWYGFLEVARRSSDREQK